jgi:cellulose synthase/poly-beta-1,6-N-acetylglucosamine synthase-like glycosyltransferase
LVAGYSLFEERDISDQGILQEIFIKLQFLELLSQYIFSMGSMSQGIAWTCTGNNLAYRRKVYDELGGYETLGLTGLEDNMLLQWVGKNSRWKVKPAFNTVYTKPTETVSQFFAQRIRWASSSLQYRLSLVAFLIMAYGLNLLVPLLIGLSFFGIISHKELIVFLSLKIVPEFLLVLKGLTLFNKIDLIKYFPLIEPLHVIYVLICGIHGLSGKFAWRGRKYREVRAEESMQDAK